VLSGDEEEIPEPDSDEKLDAVEEEKPKRRK